MHNTFVFPMDCTGVLQKWDKVEFVSTGEDKLIQGWPNDVLNYYDPFNFDCLIPEFIKIIEKIIKEENIEKNIKKWILEWGPLYSDFNKNTVNNFKDECLKFYKLWGFYTSIANRDEKLLLENIQIKTENDVNYKITFFPNDYSFIRDPSPIDELNKKLGKEVFWKPEFDMKYTFPMRIDNEEDLFEKLQNHAMIFLFKQIEEYTSRANLSWGSMKQERNKEKDSCNYKIKPVLTIDNLIDAIYLQYYILFTENEKKICPVCNTPFVPERKDKKYCSDTCKHTAKSRRYRSRKAPEQ